MNLKIYLLLILQFLFHTVFVHEAQANIQYDSYYGTTDNQKLSSLKAIVQEAKLLPDNPGTAGRDSNFGNYVSMDNNRVAVAAIRASGSGLVYLYEYNENKTKWNQTHIIRGSDSVQDDSFGANLSLLNDRLIVGAPNHENEKGAVYVFEFNGINWQQVAKLMAADATVDSRFGSSISHDGNLIVIGANSDDANGNDSGAAYVFELKNNQWIQNSKLVPDDASSGDFFGGNVSLSDNRVLISANGDDENGNNSGAAYIFEYDLIQWNQTQKLTASDGESGDNFSISVSLSGSRALIGAYRNAEGGSAYIYDLINDHWVETASLVPDNGQTNDNFGYSVHLLNNTAIIGGYRSMVTGSVYVFELNSDHWNQVAELKADDGEGGDEFGFSVYYDPDHIVIGARSDNDNGFNSGSVYIFERNNKQWLQSTKLSAGESSYRDWFGSAVALSGDLALVGSTNDGDNGLGSGSVYFYENIQGKWVFRDKLYPNNPMQGEFFGKSISISGNKAVIGADYSAYIFEYINDQWIQTANLIPEDREPVTFAQSVLLSNNTAFISDPSPIDKGYLYIFEFSNNQWSQDSLISANDGHNADRFGSSLSTFGNKVLIGSAWNDENGSLSGSAYVFESINDQWQQTAKFFPNESTPAQYFGASVSLYDDIALIGTPSFSFDALSTGAAYFFNYDDNSDTWLQTAKLVADDAMIGDTFGSSVYLQNNMALVGASNGDGTSIDTGKIYRYEFTGQQWQQVDEIFSVDSSFADLFGSAISYSNDRILVGSFSDDDYGENSGSAYIFNLDAPDVIFNSSFE